MATATIDHASTESTGEPSTPSASLDPDERFHLLQNERRRLVIRYLRDAETDDGGVRMRDVAEQVAAWEHDTTVAQLSSTVRQRVYIPLYQNHLPKLDDAGVIEYNKNRGIVTPTERMDELAALVEGTEVETDSTADADDREWSRYYLGASGVGTLMLALASLSALPVFHVTVGLVALFVAVSLAEYATRAGGDRTGA